MSGRSVRVYGNPLRHASDGTTVRVRHGKLQQTNGSFSSTEEKMRAYELLECDDTDEATEIAVQYPMAKK